MKTSMKTWLNVKMSKCKCPMNGKDLNMGSCGGMYGVTRFPDGSSRPPLIFLECHKCNYAYVAAENPPGCLEGTSEILDLVNSFHNIRYDKLKESKNGNIIHSRA